MKKLSLKNLKLDTNDLLQREQLKTVFGGYGGYGVEGNCAVTCKGEFNGEKVQIPNAPDCSQATKQKACKNWLGPYSCICVGPLI